MPLKQGRYPRQESLGPDHWSCCEDDPRRRGRSSRVHRDSRGVRRSTFFYSYSYMHTSCLPRDRKTRARRLSIHLVVGMILLSLLNLWFYLDHKENVSLTCVIILVVAIGAAPCLLWKYHEDKSLRQLAMVARAQLFTLCLFELCAVVAIVSMLGILIPSYKAKAASDPLNFNTSPLSGDAMPPDEKVLFWTLVGLFGLLLPTLIVLMMKLGDLSEQTPDTAPSLLASGLDGWRELISPEARATIKHIKCSAAIAWLACVATTGTAFATYLETDKLVYLIYCLVSLLATASSATVMSHRMAGTKLAVPGQAIAATRDVIVATQSHVFVQVVTCVSLLGRVRQSIFHMFDKILIAVLFLVINYTLIHESHLTDPGHGRKLLELPLCRAERSRLDQVLPRRRSHPLPPPGGDEAAAHVRGANGLL